MASSLVSSIESSLVSSVESALRSSVESALVSSLLKVSEAFFLSCIGVSGLGDLWLGLFAVLNVRKRKNEGLVQVNFGSFGQRVGSDSFEGVHGEPRGVLLSEDLVDFSDLLSVDFLVGDHLVEHGHVGDQGLEDHLLLSAVRVLADFLLTNQ